MDPSAERPPTSDAESKPPERRGSARSRGEQSGPLAGAPPRSAADTRRKRPAEGRYTGWRDGLDREFCATAERFLPATFPVSSHAGVATIAMAVVARRADALLVCTFSHCGAHAWPDGEIVEEHAATNQAVAEQS